EFPYGSERPVLRFQTLEAYRKHMMPPGVTDVGQWPCVMCRGAKKITDPEDHLGPYTRPGKIKCPKCGGTGAGSEVEVTKAYNKILDDFRTNYEDFVKTYNAWKAIKLSV